MESSFKDRAQEYLGNDASVSDKLGAGEEGCFCSTGNQFFCPHSLAYHADS